MLVDREMEVYTHTSMVVPLLCLFIDPEVDGVTSIRCPLWWQNH